MQVMWNGIRPISLSRHREMVSLTGTCQCFNIFQELLVLDVQMIQKVLLAFHTTHTTPKDVVGNNIVLVEEGRARECSPTVDIESS